MLVAALWPKAFHPVLGDLHSPITLAGEQIEWRCQAGPRRRSHETCQSSPASVEVQGRSHMASNCPPRRQGTQTVPARASGGTARVRGDPPRSSEWRRRSLQEPQLANSKLGRHSPPPVTGCISIGITQRWRVDASGEPAQIETMRPVSYACPCLAALNRPFTRLQDGPRTSESAGAERYQ